MLHQFILRTPLIPYRSSLTNQSPPGIILLKAENLQIFGSYKIRGVASAIMAANPEKLKYGLETVSAGNMAQAVAFAAKQLKIPCRVFVPNSAPDIKKQAIQKLGADLIERPFGEIWEMVRQFRPEAHQGLLIHPIHTEGILKGYGSIAQEILEDHPDTEALVIPFGVGGLSLGLARKMKQLNPQVKIYACEPSTAAPLQASLEAGKPMSVHRQASFIDAIGTPEVLPEVFNEIKNLVSASLVITPKEARIALQELLSQHKLLAEGAAGVCLAASHKVSELHPQKKVVCILSGGNIAPEQLVRP